MRKIPFALLKGFGISSTGRVKLAESLNTLSLVEQLSFLEPLAINPAQNLVCPTDENR